MISFIVHLNDLQSECFNLPLWNTWVLLHFVRAVFTCNAFYILYFIICVEMFYNIELSVEYIRCI